MAIEKRYRRYFVSLDVPKDVQGKLRRKRWRKSLDTESLSVAKRRAPLVIAQWKAEIEQARGNGDDDVVYLRKALAAAYKPAQRRQVEELVEQAWEQRGRPAYSHGPGVEPLDDGREAAAREAADQWLKEVRAVRLADHLDVWAEQADLAPKTKHVARTKLTRFIGKFPTVEDCTRERAQAYVNELSAELSSGTIRGDLGFIRSFWRYLVRNKLAQGEPFDRLELPKQRRNGKKRAPFTVQEIRMMIDHAGEGPLHDLILLASHTGCRISELCELKVEDVDEELIHIRAGKSEAAIRDVPIHSAIKGVVKRLKEQSTDGWLISGQSMDQFNRRSGGLRAKFRRLKAKLEFGPEKNFHSIRRFVSTCLHEAGVPEPIAANLLGHEIPHLTYGLYAGQASNKVKAKALEKAIRVLR